MYRDQDLASGGVLALPDEAGLIVGGKDGVYYHVSRSTMGKRDYTKLLDQPFVASFDYHPTNGHTSLFQDLNQVSSTDPFTIGPASGFRTAHIHGTGVYFNNLLFVQGENNKVRVFSRVNGHFKPDPIARGNSSASWGTASPGGMPGGILSLSANGTSNAILWANEAFGNAPAILTPISIPRRTYFEPTMFRRSAAARFDRSGIVKLISTITSERQQSLLLP